MADKQSVLFSVKTLKMQLGFIPNFASLKKALKAVENSIPESLRDSVASRDLLTQMDAFVKAENFGNALQAYGTWADNAITTLERIDEDSFEAKRGRDSLNAIVSLFGKTQEAYLHSADLVSGSMLGDLMTNPSSHSSFTEGQYRDLHQILNVLRSGLNEIVPSQYLPKRAKKGEADAESVVPAIPETEETENTVSDEVSPE